MAEQTPRDPPHYLHPLKSDTTPKRLVWLDCIGASRADGRGFVESWAGATMGTTHYTSRRRERVDTEGEYTNAGLLWEAVDGFCGANRRVVLFTYDLPRQLRLSQALVWLPEMGWALERLALVPTSSWAAFRQNGRSLLLCDLRSWAPKPLSAWATAVHVELPTLPRHGATPTALYAASLSRLHTIRDSTLTLLDWTASERLGPSRPTGSGASYAAFKRRFLHDRLLVHDDTTRLAAERAAMHAGRCEVWKHGRFKVGRFKEWDMRGAYPTIAAQCAVPTIAQGSVQNPTHDVLMALLSHYAILAHAEVRTRIPCIPAHLDGRTVWPVGRFDTWIWDPELRVALSQCSHLRVVEAYAYSRAPALDPFARWVLDGMGEPPTDTNGVQRMVLKHWSRSLVGRLGLRYRVWEHFADSPTSEARLATFADIDTGQLTDMLMVGHRWLLLSDMVESSDSLPQIPSWIMSECRARLWKAIRLVGEHNVMYMDTDSLLVDATSEAGDRETEHWLREQGWTVKGRYRSATLSAPRNIELDGMRRVSGIPTTAMRTTPREYRGKVTESVGAALRQGNTTTVRELQRTFNVKAVDHRRIHLPNHLTAPIEADLQYPEG